MHSATVFFALAAVAAVSAGEIVNDIHAYPAYKYSYGVSDKLTGDKKSATEIRDGGVTKGSYSLVQPDGILRTVNYVVTPLGGFQAQVINDGIAGHPSIVGKGLGLGAGIVAAPGLALGGGRLGLGLGYGSGLGLGLGARSYVGGLGSPLAAAGLGPVGIAGVGPLGVGLAGVGPVGLGYGLGAGYLG